MAIPDYQSIMRPLLALAADGQSHRITDAVTRLADQFELSAEERKDLLPSGRQATFSNRVGWARAYLSKAGLLDSSQRGVFTITSRGREALSTNPERINVTILRQYEEFRAFKAASADPVAPDQLAIATIKTPEELLEESYQELRRGLAQDLLEKIKQNSPAYFERLVVDVLVAMGYGGSRPDAGRALGRSGDGGIDGVIDEDVLGLDVVYIQAKRWEGPVHRPTVQEFVGSLEGHRARKGVLISTSTFSSGARDYVRMIDKRVILVDGQRLAELMIDHGVGVTAERSYVLNRVDLDYFEEA